MRKRTVAVLLVSMMQGLPEVAFAANCATISSISPSSPSIPTWDPLNPATQTVTFSVTLNAAGSNQKSVALIFLDSDSNATPTRIGTTTGPRYQILNGSTVISFPSGTSVAGQTVPTANFSNNTVTISLQAQVLANNSPTEDFIGGTVYSETLGLAVQCFKSNGQSNGTDTYTNVGPALSLTIPKELSIVTASPVTINFGNFTTTSQQAQISIKSTSTLNVSVATSNGSQMVRSGAVSPYPANSTIPYTMTFNGVTVAPGAPLSNQTRAGVLGSTYPLQLSLTGGIPSGKLAGTYSDTITLTIVPGQ